MRYEALYLHKGFCDGFWDNNRERYLTDNEIENILNNNYNQTKVWQNKYDELKKENEQLKTENNMLRTTISRNEIYIKKLTRKSKLSNYTY